MGKFGNVIPKNRKIYGNWRVLSPEGILMFRCDEKKAMWYVNRDLGEITQDSEVKLKFNPNGLGNHQKHYGLNEMDNICVVCGTNEFLTRHHVVPYCYRKYFPLEIKSHNFHDVLSLCVDCHENYEVRAREYKNKLAVLYNAPLNGDLFLDKDLIRAKRLASSLVNFIQYMPKDRISKIKSELKNILGVKKLHNSRIHSLLKIDMKNSNKNHGEIVVSKLDNINDFMSSWRSHFIVNNECKYLPKNWKI